MKTKLTFRIWLLIFILLFSLISIFGIPPSYFQKGVLITSVGSNSTAFDEGLRQGQIISQIDGNPVNNLTDYTNIVSNKFPSNENVKTTIQTTKAQIILFSNSSPDITVSDIKKTNIQTGLDISGGARALVEAENRTLSQSDASELADVIRNRLNVYGLEDIKVSPVTDFSGNNYVKIEIAGATPEDLKSLISEQGKFEAKIGNQTVFVGGEKDIASVGRDAQNARIESCDQANESGYLCRFSFTVTLSGDAAKRHAEITQNLSVNFTNGGNYLSKKLDLYLDDKLVDSLLISEGLKGRVTTQISVSGSGTGDTVEAAQKDAKNQMARLQTILITGSLPYKLKISRLDTISPSLGKEFINSILLAGAAALIAVSLLIFLRYKNIKISMALLFTSLSEVVIILGIASFIKWSLDLPSIAGILATIGTGLDQQIIILDESRDKYQSLIQRLKRALGIILGAYLTATASLIPLYWAAAGFFKGFAITTIIGITAGILITRPAFSDMIRRIEE